MKIKNAKVRTAENTPKVCRGCDERIPTHEARWHDTRWWHRSCLDYHDYQVARAG